MNVPSFADRAVKVWAYLTDETFGYTHWRAAQFSAPAGEGRPAVLVVCETPADRDAVIVGFLARQDTTLDAVSKREDVTT